MNLSSIESDTDRREEDSSSRNLYQVQEKEREIVMMEVGKYVWYTYDLRKEPVRVKIFRVFIDIHGDVRWIWAATRDGRMLDDYVNMFSIRKPVVYDGM